MPNKPTTLRESLIEEALDLLHEVIIHTPLTLQETGQRDYDKGYIFYQDLVVQTVKDLEPRFIELIDKCLTYYSPELISKIEEKQNIFNFIPQDKYGYKRVKATDLDIINLIKQ